METNTCYTPLCPRRESCTLWRNALECIDRGTMFLGVVNPKTIQEAGGYDHCPLFYEYKLRRFARGFVWSYPDLTLSQLHELHDELFGTFGYSKIVRMRCGYEAISPEEQEPIASIFEDLAPSVTPEYKGFEEHYTKPPRVEGKAARKLLK